MQIEDDASRDEPNRSRREEYRFRATLFQHQASHSVKAGKPRISNTGT